MSNKYSMKDFNLTRAMEGCCIEIDREYYDELFDYLIETDVDLNELNIDDLVVNGVQFLEEDYDDCVVLKETADGAWII